MKTPGGKVEVGWRWLWRRKPQRRLCTMVIRESQSLGQTGEMVFTMRGADEEEKENERHECLAKFVEGMGIEYMKGLSGTKA